jgi:LAO/AO transport system kinase
VLATDPTGAHTGGAVLGDRVRMRSLSRDPNVFIRSVAARDPLRTLSRTAPGVVALLTRLGFDYVLVEAVGAGQSDIGTSLVADTTVLVLVPGLGDDVQAMKSGVMEVADVIAVNKADLPLAAQTAKTVRQSVKLLKDPGERIPPVIEVSATERTGIERLIAQVDAHGRAAEGRADERSSELLIDLVIFEVTSRLRRELPGSPLLSQHVAAVQGRDTATIRAALELADGVLTPTRS